MARARDWRRVPAHLMRRSHRRGASQHIVRPRVKGELGDPGGVDHPERIQVFIQALLEGELMAFFWRWKVGASSGRRCPIGLPEWLRHAALAHLGDRDDHGAVAAGLGRRSDWRLGCYRSSCIRRGRSGRCYLGCSCRGEEGCCLILFTHLLT